MAQKKKKGKRRTRRTKKTLRPEYERALKQSMKELDALLKKLARL